MLKKVEIEAKNASEALVIAAEQFKVPAQKIKVTALKERKGILGIGASGTYEATIKINPVHEGKSFLEQLFKDIEVEITMELRTLDDGREVFFTIDTDENPLLIGKEGRNLEALQLIVKTIINAYYDERIMVSVDIGRYKENRQRQIEILATKVAKEVARTNIPAKLEPMNAFERRIVHNKLNEWRDVYTESEGEGEHRCTVIKPRKKSKY